MAQRALHLLVIDPQNDFCDLPPAYWPTDPESGSRRGATLPVPGAHADMQRLAAIVEEGAAGLTGITVTLDSHHHVDIGHPAFWLTAEKGPVSPFTQISAADVRAGKYRPRPAGSLARVQAYLDSLEAAARYTHMVWPQHCEIGSWGHNIHHDLRRALNRWENRLAESVTMVVKGTNPWTEHYSAVMAEVPDPADPATLFNTDLLLRLEGAERIFIAGEAASHCVKATCEHIVDALPPESLHKLVLIEDCMSAVTGFEAQAAEFMAAMRKRGVQIMRSPEMAAELKANA
jgi:nicotinamidase-related amidase